MTAEGASLMRPSIQPAVTGIEITLQFHAYLFDLKPTSSSLFFPELKDEAMAGTLVPNLSRNFGFSNYLPSSLPVISPPEV